MLVGSPPSSRRSQQQPSSILSTSSSEQLAGFTPTATFLLRMGPSHRHNNGGAALSSRTSLPTTTTTTQYQQQLQQQYHRSPPKHDDSSLVRRDTRFHNGNVEDDLDGTRSVVPQQQPTALLRSHDEAERDVEAPHIGLSVVELTSPERRSPSDRHNRNEDDADDVLLPRHSSSSLSPLSQASMDDPSTGGRDGSHSPFGSPTTEQRADRQQPPQRPPTAPKYTPVRAASAGGTSSALSTDSDSKRTSGTRSALSPQAHHHHHHHSDDEERHSSSPMEYFSASRRPRPVAAVENDGVSSAQQHLNEDDAEVLLAKMAYRQYMQHAEKSLRKLYEAVDTVPVEEELQNEERGTREEFASRDSRGDEDGSIVTVDMSFSSDPLPQSYPSRSSGPATREELPPPPPLPSLLDPLAERGSERIGRQQREDASPPPPPPRQQQEVKRQEALGEFRAPNRSRVVVVGASSKTSGTPPMTMVGAETAEEETKGTISFTSAEAQAGGNGEVPSTAPPAPPRQLWVFGEDEEFPTAVRHISATTTTVSVANKTTTAASRPTPQLTVTAASAMPERQTLLWPNSEAPPNNPSDKKDEERQANDDRHNASLETGEGQISSDPNVQQQSEVEEEMFFAAVRHAQPLAPWQRVLSVAPHKASVDEHAPPRQDDAISIVRTPLAKSRVLHRNPILSFRPPPPFPSSSLALSQKTKKSESGATTAAMRERRGDEDEDEPSDALESSSGTVVVVATTSASASPQTSPTTSPSVAVPRDHHHFENGPLFLPDSHQQHNNHNVTAAPSQPLLRPQSPPPPSIVVEKPSPTPSASQARFIALMSGSKVPPPPPPPLFAPRHPTIMEQFPSYVDPSPVSPSASTLRGVEDGAISPSVRSTSSTSSIQFEEAATEDAHPTDDDAIAVVLTEVENVALESSPSSSSSSSVMFHEEVDHEDDKAASVATTLPPPPPPNASAPPSPPLLSPSSTWQPITTSGEYSPSRQNTTTRATTTITTAGSEAVPPLPPPRVVESAGFSLLQAAVERTTPQRSARPPRLHQTAATSASSERPISNGGGGGTPMFPSAQDRGTTDSPQFFEESASDAIDQQSRSVGAAAVSRVRSATMLLHAQQPQLSVMERISERGDDDGMEDEEEEGEIRTEDVRWTSSDDSGTSWD